MLARDLTRVTLYGLYRDLGLGVNDDDDGSMGAGGWQKAMAGYLENLRERNAEAMAVSVAEILSAEDDGDDVDEGGATLKSVS